MRPALSIVLFTTSSGTGFALLLLLGLGAPLGLLPVSPGFGFVGLSVATLLAAAGLISSAFHLAHPERAWCAFSQWRSSWLSREGVFSLLTFLLATVFGVGWVFFGTTDRLVGLCGILTAALAATTVYCTGMIYASLKPVHQWHNGWVLPNYLALGLMGGCLVLDFLVRLWSSQSSGVTFLTTIVVLTAWWAKERYWRFITVTTARSTVATATALGNRGPIRLLEAPHTEENYLLKEMGFRLARKHARRLRRIARLAGFAWPAGLNVFGLFVGGLAGGIAAALAIIGAAMGLLAERWLFFAEAKHTVMLYYGADAV
jgi:sulfite dehydrogenase (quinone) subunit SoeC